MAEKRKDSKGRNLKENEDQMPDGRYRYRYTDKAGNRHAIYSWRLVSTDKVPAGKRDKMSLREKEAAIEADKTEGIKGREAERITLNEMFDLYISGKTELKQSTITDYKYMYKKFVSEEIGKRKISSIKYSDIKLFYTSLIKDLCLKPNSMEIIHCILHPIFNLAVRDGYIRNNPTDGVMKEIKKKHNFEKSNRHALTEEEQEIFINFVAASDIYRHWLPLITFFLGTGCRIGETIGLRWEDCDFKDGTISINHNLIYKMQESGHCEFHITTPKTTSGCRTIPMLSDVKAALMNERILQMSKGFNKTEIDGYSGFVFLNKNGDVHNPISINYALKRMIKACNEQEAEKAKNENREAKEIRNFSAHNLRHTFCTRFCENETNIKVIQEIMGHSDISTTMNIYAEATESKKKESFVNLEGKIKIS